MSACSLKASPLCNRAPMQQCSHTEYELNSLWPPKCCSLLRQPRFNGTCQVLDHTLLLYAAYLPTLLISRHVSHSHQPRTALSAGPLRQWRRVQSKYCAPSVSLACSAAPKLSTVKFAVLVHSPLPVLKRRAPSFPWSVVFSHYIPYIFVETQSIARVSKQCCYHKC